MPKYANPADKLSKIASAPWEELPKQPTIVDIAMQVRIDQLEFLDVATQ